MGLFDFLTDAIGIDPGSQHLRIIKGDQLIFNEPTKLSVERIGGSVSGIGNALRVTDKDVILSPVDFSIKDFHAFEMLLREAIKREVKADKFFKSYAMYFSIPITANEVEKRTYRDSAQFSGAKEVYFIEQSYCAAIGLNILDEVKDFILIDFGSSKIEIAIFSNGEIRSVGIVRMGTSKIVRLLKNHFKRKYKIELSEKEIAGVLSSIHRYEPHEEIMIQSVTVNRNEIQEVLTNFFVIANDEVLEAIEYLDHDKNIQKIKHNGIYFTGGGSAYDFLREQINIDGITQKSKSQNPLLDNSNGLKKVIAEKEKYKKYLTV